MKLKLLLLLFCVKTTMFVFAQSQNSEPTFIENLNQVSKEDLTAPNSYIYDVDLAKNNNYGGLYIPVKKAYDVWADTSGFLNKTIPNGKQSVSVVWQTKLELINSLSIEGEGIDAKLKVGVNPSKGKGTALIALHVGDNGDNDDPIYWSWLVWITDDPTINAVTYVNNADSRMVNTFMNRNLGAIANNFMGNDWNKAAGLMFQWGRKDPFPRMRYADETLLTYYTFDNEVINNYNFQEKIVKTRAYDLISDNIKYSVQNPLYFINSTEYAGAWFASDANNKKEVNSQGYATQNYDLWGDNNEGFTSPTSFEQKEKSAYDPCPAGWRVPSFAHANSTKPNYSPWGSGYNYIENEDPNVTINESSNRYPNAKFYPRMGVEFKNGSDNYNLGTYSLTGGYKKHNDDIFYQDNYAELNLWSATLQGNVQGRNFHIINDPDQKNNPYLINTAQESPTISGFAVRCAKDTGTKTVYNTDFFYSNINNYEEGLNNPNSYILYDKREVSIPVNKAYAVYNQILTEQQMIPSGKQTANVYWTTNSNLIKSLEVTGNSNTDKINVKLNDNQYGNAIVSLHIGDKGNSNDPIYWSWHIWVPKSNPEENTITYNSDKSTKSNFRAYKTKLGFPPMKTEFMNRVLGAVETYEPNQVNDISTETYGMLYQWGRKDALPGFYNVSWEAQYPIYVGKNSGNNTISYSKIADNSAYVNLGYQKPNLQNNFSKNEMLTYAIQNPLDYLYNTNSGSADWLSNIKLNDNRWSHAAVKSVYDPCPKGWRVPDYGFKYPIGSPWGKADLISINSDLSVVASEKLSDYKVNKIYVRDGYKIVKAFAFYDQSYKIGYLPATGSRRYIESKGGANMYDFIYAASLWSATVTNEYSGYVFGIDAYDDYYNINNTISPSVARNVVCAKDVQRFTKDYFDSIDQEDGDDELKIPDVDKNSNSLSFYPNPIKNVLNSNIDVKGEVKIFTINGNKVLQGKFVNKQLNVSQLKTGVYILLLDTGKSYKLIKK
ncbi:T9SS type A sorting domain-containing protein [Chishuiella sp.]|uniref:T9SS type A sorting domain-containing protein n=1 Tax=Chishuiella sp. TaxID=1969467 RepID=UPI0028B1CC77|nr:T9SS type A sorting domain-containing protein [Chishuiella sp.]